MHEKNEKKNYNQLIKIKKGRGTINLEESYKGCPADPMFWFGSSISRMPAPSPSLPKSKEKLVVLRPIGGYVPDTHTDPSFLGKEIKKVNGLR